MINTTEVNGISIVAHSESLAAKAMMYRLIIERSFGFLYTAKLIRRFPVILITFIERQTLASMITTAKLLGGNSSEDLSASVQKLPLRFNLSLLQFEIHLLSIIFPSNEEGDIGCNPGHPHLY